MGMERWTDMTKLIDDSLNFVNVPKHSVLNMVGIHYAV